MLLHRAEDILQTENGWLIRGDAADVLLIFMTDDVIRIRVHFDKTEPMEEASYTLVTTAWPDRMDDLLRGERRRIQALQVPCRQEANAYSFQTQSVRLLLEKEPFSFSLYNRAGNLLYQDLRERAFERDSLGRLSHYSRMDIVHDHFYGFGEKTGALDKKGRRLRMSPKDAVGHDPESGDPLYKHIPFYLRVNDIQRHTLGLFYHNSYDCVFDLGQERSGYWEPYCYYQTDGGDIDLFLIDGPTPAHVIDRYTWLTGRSMLPARQMLGYCASAMYYTELDSDCDCEIERVLDKHEKEGLPIDNFWLASGYSAGETDHKRYVFHWNRRRFPDPKSFLESMEQRGVNLIPNLKPGILPGHPEAEKLSSSNVFIKTADGRDDYRGRWWGGAGRFFDFTNPAARRVWKQLLKENILQLGVKTVWNDNCEFDGVEDRAAQCNYEGKTGDMARLKSLQANLMAYTARQALAEVCPGERPRIVSRAGFAGIQRYAQVWGGDNRTDWRTLKFNVAVILGMGLSGCANMGCDIGGFSGPAPDAELLLRWIQNGIFQPRFCINSANDDNTVTQPWMYEEILSQVRAAFALRYRLLPYLYSLMYEASQTGLPVWRPLFLEFPGDPACYTDTGLTFLYGKSLLVANVLEPGAKTRRVYLPAGCSWYDCGDNFRRYEGGRTVELPVTPDSIPMLLRGSAIVVSSGDIHHIAQDVVRRLDLLIAAETDTDFVWYEDDGHTNDWQTGSYCKTHIRVRAGDRTEISLQTEGSYPCTLERISLRLVGREKGAYWVAVDGRRLPGFVVQDFWEQADCGWFYHPADRTIWVKFPAPAQAFCNITVSTETFDLIAMA